MTDQWTVPIITREDHLRGIALEAALRIHTKDQDVKDLVSDALAVEAYMTGEVTA